ncbi:DNRLRE domain-containing protein [Phytohabitans flavus]|uniref:DNRLRE domain-containing protein n=1 Tax=Phytohabitans flavus TaxID=1076124 RepID=UPI00362D9980
MVRLGRLKAMSWTIAVLLVPGVGVTPLPAAGVGAAGSGSPEPVSARPEPREPLAAAREHASEVARATGQKVPIEEMTTENAKVWALPNGRFESVIASGPVRFKRDGRWTEVDLTLHARPDGTVAPAAHLNDLTLAGRREGGESDLASIKAGGTRRAMRWSDGLPEPVLDGKRAIYRDVLPGIDLVAEAQMTGYEQFTVIKNRAALAHYDRAQAALKLGDAASKPDGHGGLVHNAGSTPAPLMWDAAKDATGGPKNVHKVGLSRVDGRFGLAAEKAWLHDPARRFPITVDPSDQSQVAYGGQDTWVRSGTTTRYWTSPELESGTQDGGGTKRIAYVNFTAQGMSGATIHYANVKLWGTYAASCDAYNMLLFPASGNIFDSTYWDNRPDLMDAYGNGIGKNGNGDAGAYAFTAAGHSLRPSNGVCTGQWLDHEAAGVFQVAANKGYGAFAVAFTPYWDNTNAYYRRFKAYDSGTHPHAIVSWSFPPGFVNKSTTPTTSCTTGTGRPAIGTAQPTLSARYSQSDGHNVDVHFEYGEVGSSATTVRYVTVGADTTANYQIPPGELVDGKSYRWQTIAKSAAGVWSTGSGWCEFTVDIWSPPAPGCPGVVTEKADFNGDGYVDKAIGDPLKASAGLWESGAVTVADGRTGTQTTLDQSLPEVPDTAEASDRFGSSIAVVDVNRDGCADLAIGTPYEDLTAPDAGQVDILYGTPAGLGKGPAAETFVQGVNRVPGAQGAYDWFGFALVAGQTSGGEPFIVVGAPGDDVGGVIDAGTATYIRGEHRIAMEQSIVSGQSNETDDRFGTAVAATGNQLAISMPGESGSAATQFAGRVCTFRHTITNNRLELLMCISQSDFGVNGFEAGDEFGKSISMAPYRTIAGGPIDSILLVGAPGEDDAGFDDTGVVHFYKVTGSAVSLLSTNWKAGRQTGDRFGEKTLVVNLDPTTVVTDAKLVAAVGAPGTDAGGNLLDSGEVRVFPAGRTGTLTYDVAVRPGTAAARTLIGVAVGGNGTHLFAPSVYQGMKSLYAIRWTDLVAGSAAVDAAATVVAPTGSIAFGAQAG